MWIPFSSVASGCPGSPAEEFRQGQEEKTALEKGYKCEKCIDCNCRTLRQDGTLLVCDTCGTEQSN